MTIGRGAGQMPFRTCEATHVRTLLICRAIKRYLLIVDDWLIGGDREGDQHTEQFRSELSELNQDVADIEAVIRTARMFDIGRFGLDVGDPPGERASIRQQLDALDEALDGLLLDLREVVDSAWETFDASGDRPVSRAAAQIAARLQPTRDRANAALARCERLRTGAYSQMRQAMFGMFEVMVEALKRHRAARDTDREYDPRDACRETDHVLLATARGILAHAQSFDDDSGPASDADTGE